MFLLIAFFIVRIFLAILLVTAGAAKIADRVSFKTTLVSLGMPARHQKLVSATAIATPFMEIFLGLFVVSGLWALIINAILLGVMSGFTLIVLFGLFKAPHATCHCFGALSNSQFSKRGLLRNLLLTGAALTVLLLTNRFPLPQSPALLPMELFLVAGYLLLALCTAQATRIMVLVKERVSL